MGLGDATVLPCSFPAARVRYSVDVRSANITRTDLNQQESAQVLKYDVGQFARAHLDYSTRSSLGQSALFLFFGRVVYEFK